MKLRQYALLALIYILSLTGTGHGQDGVQSPETFLDYELGEQWTPHHKVMNYVHHVAEHSPMADIRQYGTTNEGKELVYLVVSTEQNMARKEQIRTNNLKRAGLMEGTPTEDTTAIVWLSYNVHGNETSSSEAAMKTLYELVSEQSRDTKRWLRNTLVIMDPMLNPDGRDRYVYWYKQTVGEEYNARPEAREHREPWPNGRTNHYYFDLNRDWAWLTQKESRQRNEIYQQWLPHIHVDFHEQGHNSPYYFAPAAEPFHKAITEWQRNFQYTIGENHAEYFNRNNWMYFTREVFDLFYPSYGDTYPIFNGAIGMTYEQAGQVGLGIRKVEGDTLTLKNRLTHHYTTGISTVEVTSEHAEQVVGEFAAYYQNALETPAGQYKTFVIDGDNNPDKLRSLFSLLEQHNVQFGKAPGNRTYEGYNYRTGRNERVQVSADDYLVSTYQPKSVLARIFFEPRPELSDSVTYDITAWEQHYAFGLDGHALRERVDPVPAEIPRPTAEIDTSGTPYTYLAEWQSFTDLKVLAELLTSGIKIHIAGELFTLDGETYTPGTLIITRSANESMGSRFDHEIMKAAATYGQVITPVSTGFVDAGPDLGSNEVAFMEKPRVALLVGDGTSSYNAGEIWHFFDKQIDYPVTLLDTGYFSSVDLNKYDVLILPDGYYGSEVITDNRLSEIRNWVQHGGRLIAVAGANRFLSGKDGFILKAKEQEDEDEKGEGEEQVNTTYNQRQREQISESNSGSIFRITMDPTHPLGYGYQDAYFSLKLDTDAYAYLEEGWNTGIAEEDAHMSGFIGHQAKMELEHTLAFGTQSMGEGTVVYMVDNPLFRAFWHNGKLLFGNAVFMVGQ